MAVMTVSVPISIERAGTAPEKTTTQGRFFALDLLDNRFAALHGLRVLAIVSVVAYHVTWIFMGEQHIALDPAFFAQSIAVFFGMDLQPRSSAAFSSARSSCTRARRARRSTCAGSTCAASFARSRRTT